MSNDDKTIRVGSRKSELALIQTKHVIALLQKLYRNKKFEIPLIERIRVPERYTSSATFPYDTMSTIGDRVLNVSLPKIGEKSLFTRDLEDALRNGGVDFVVHSLKDLPTALPTGMAIGAVLEREDARDALVLRENLKNHTLQTLPAGCVIGTSSLRRTAQLRRQYPHLTVCDIRGNLNTRLAKLDASDSKFSGIILAQAGLVRMGWMSRISQVLEPNDLLYAVGQGALAVECRSNDTEILAMLRSLNCLPTTCRILAERSFLKTLGGGCSAPVAVVSKLNGNGRLDRENNADEASLALEGAVWSLNGATEIRDQLCCTLVVSESKKRAVVGNVAGNGDGDGIVNVDEPPEKRTRQPTESNNKSSPQRLSPTVINDDIVSVEGITDSYDLKALIEKHMDLAKKCPVIGSEAKAIQDNGNITARCSGGGDADCNAATTSSGHCPLHIDVGQDFMGQCPFLDNEVKVSLASVGKCPITHTTTNTASNNNNEENGKSCVNNEGDDQVDRIAPPPALSKCPFTAAVHDNPTECTQSSQSLAVASADDATNNASISGIHTKCPFLQKTVEMFDYGDEEKPPPKEINVLMEDVDDLFCGLYQHKCFNRDLYIKANKLGQQLADNLIKKGALDVMHVAQAEIHSKIS